MFGFRFYVEELTLFLYYFFKRLDGLLFRIGLIIMGMSFYTIFFYSPSSFLIDNFVKPIDKASSENNIDIYKDLFDNGFGFGSIEWFDLESLREKIFYLPCKPRPNVNKDLKTINLILSNSKKVFEVDSNKWICFYLHEFDLVDAIESENDVPVYLYFDFKSENEPINVYARFDSEEIKSSFELKRSVFKITNYDVDKNVFSSHGAHWCGIEDYTLSNSETKKNRILFLEPNAHSYSISVDVGQPIFLTKEMKWTDSNIQNPIVTAVLNKVSIDNLEFHVWGENDLCSQTIYMNKEKYIFDFPDISFVKISSVRSKKRVFVNFGSNKVMANVGCWIILKNELTKNSCDIDEVRNHFGPVIFIDSIFSKSGKWFVKCKIYNSAHSDFIEAIISEEKTEIFYDK